MATIKTSVTDTSPIPNNIFTKGNFVIFKSNVKVIICVDKSIDSFTFSGQVIEDRTLLIGGRGECRSDWNKSLFTQFYGTVTIESTL